MLVSSGMGDAGVFPQEHFPIYAGKTVASVNKRIFECEMKKIVNT